MTLKRKKPADNEKSSSDEDDGNAKAQQSAQEKTPSTIIDAAGAGPSSLTSSTCDAVETGMDDSHENDLGRYLGRSSMISEEKKRHLLTDCWIPPKTYDFAADATHLKRKFNYQWLDTYSPWMAYSKRLKGALCKYCVLFPPALSTVKGVLGSFIVRPFTKYKDIHEACRNHSTSQWHMLATESARAFTHEVPVDIQVQKFHHKIAEENRKVISSIITCIAFSGTHDLPLRGKHQDEGVLEDLCRLRIEAGDLPLKEHFEHGKKNSSYRSPQIQNEIINLCGSVIRDYIVKSAKQAYAYSILADETADISGKEQLSIGLRFYDLMLKEIREEFVGFVELEALDSKSIAKAIDDFVTEQELLPEKCVGLGFDGCSTMAGNEGGVQAILKKKYTRALFFHCSSHRLNLVVNDLNLIPEIRNTVATIKDIITYFRESVLRRKLIPNIPRLCETRWSEKYKCIRIFKENFREIVQALETLSVQGNTNTRKSAFQLHSAASKSSFIMAMVLIAKYSAVLEPVVNALQSKTLDLVKVSDHIHRIVDLLKSHRENVETIADELLKDANHLAEQLGVELTIARTVGRQQHRSNPPASNASEFWRRSLIVPYLDSVITSLKLRFSNENSPAFALTYLHPSHMLTMNIDQLKQKTNSFTSLYHLDGLDAEIEIWYKMWMDKKLTEEELRDLNVSEFIKEAVCFFPTTKKALLILLAQPCTTSTVERSFSSLRRIKTWLRSTMGEDRLIGLAMMSVHRKFVFRNYEEFLKEVVDKFAANPRKLVFS